MANPCLRLCIRRDYLILLLVVAMLALLITMPSIGRSRAGRRVSSSPDADYISALATANRFLYAWQSHDEEAGLLLLTAAAKKRSSEQKVSDFFTAAPVVTYEIGRGKKSGAGSYIFPLTLYGSDTGKQGHLHPRYSQVSVVKTGKGDWGIDTLP